MISVICFLFTMLFLLKLRYDVQFKRLKGFHYDYIILKIMTKYKTYTRVFKLYEQQ